MQEDCTAIAPCGEELQWIPGFTGYFATKDGRIFSNKYGDLRELKPWVGTTGYRWVALRRDGETYNRRVHHLVLESFIGPRPDSAFGCHADDNKLNNCVENLRWDSRRANVDDAMRNGRHAKGQDSAQARFKNHDIIKMRQLYSEGMNQYKIAELYGTSQGVISNILSGRSWGHLPLAG